MDWRLQETGVIPTGTLTVTDKGDGCCRLRWDGDVIIGISPEFIITERFIRTDGEYLYIAGWIKGKGIGYNRYLNVYIFELEPSEDREVIIV